MMEGSGDLDVVSGELRADSIRSSWLWMLEVMWSEAGGH